MFEILLSTNVARVIPTYMWAKLRDYPVPARGLRGATVGDLIYFYGGNVGGIDPQSYQQLFYSYDPKSDTYEALTPGPIGRASASVASQGNKFYVIGGYGETTVPKILHEYDTVSKTWVERPTIPGTFNVNSLSSSNGKLYATVYNTTSQYTELYRYDPLNPTGAWVKLANLPTAGLNAGTVVGNSDGLYYFSGRSYGVYSTAVFFFNTLTNVWSQLPNMPKEMSSGYPVCINNEIFLVNGSPSQPLEIYKLVGGSLVVQPQLSNSIMVIDFALAAWNKEMHIFGGSTIAGIVADHYAYKSD